MLPTFENGRPGRWLRLVSRADFMRLLGAAIEEVLVRGGIEQARARRLRGDALVRFATRMKLGARRVRALTKTECLAELEREHGSLLRRRLQWTEELAGLESELADVRAKTSARFLTSAEEELLARSLLEDARALVREGGSEAALAAFAEREAGRRARALAAVQARERERIDVLERRVAKLCTEIQRMEGRLAELARRAELDPGLPSIYRTVQGLDEGEPERAAKAVMLARIFEQNLVLQRSLAPLERNAG
jgi:hypothetical protein